MVKYVMKILSIKLIFRGSLARIDYYYSVGIQLCGIKLIVKNNSNEKQITITIIGYSLTKLECINSFHKAYIPINEKDEVPLRVPVRWIISMVVSSITSCTTLAV